MGWSVEGREMDLLVALNVMGFHALSWKVPHLGGERRWSVFKDSRGAFSEQGAREAEQMPADIEKEQPFRDALRDVPRFSTDLAAAWTVVDRLKALNGGSQFTLTWSPARKQWTAQLMAPDIPARKTPWERRHARKTPWVGVARTEAEAICDLALKRFA